MNRTNHPVVTFDHLTLNTGHNLTHRDFAPNEEAAKVVSKLTSSGRHRLNKVVPNVDDAALDMTNDPKKGIAFGIVRGGTPVVFCTACVSEEYRFIDWEFAIDAYKELQIQWYRLGAASAESLITGPSVCRPPGLFLTVHLLPALTLHMDMTLWLGDFERCLFWALWAERTAQTK
jgi:hypothetical protein